MINLLIGFGAGSLFTALFIACLLMRSKRRLPTRAEWKKVERLIEKEITDYERKELGLKPSFVMKESSEEVEVTPEGYFKRKDGTWL